MADGIRGKNFESYPHEVQKGILLHRSIDTYTDAHPVFRESTKRLHERYHHYAGVIVDVFYDHFLSKNWTKYSSEPLQDFIQRFYSSLTDNYAILSDRTKGMMPYMIRENWLYSYRTIEGISNILTQMDRRTKNQSSMRFSPAELTAFYSEFEAEFTLFFEDLRQHCTQKLLTL